MANSLNMLIAKTHRTGGQLVGLQLTNGNIIAICLSVAQVVAGLVSLSLVLAAGLSPWAGIPLCFFVGIFGCFLAVLVERFSLGGLIAIRVANKYIAELTDEQYLMLKAEKRKATEEDKEDLEYRLKPHKNSRTWSTPIVALGVILSGALGDIFWHKLFSPAGELVAWPFSVGIAAVISLTFVYSELFKEVQDNSLKEVVADTTVYETVLLNEHRSIQIELATQVYDDIRNDDAKRARALGDVENTVIASLADFSALLPSLSAIDALQSLPAPHATISEIPQDDQPRIPEHALALGVSEQKKTIHELDAMETMLYKAVKKDNEVFALLVKLAQSVSIEEIARELKQLYPTHAGSFSVSVVTHVMDVIMAEQGVLVAEELQQNALSSQTPQRVHVKRLSTAQPREKVATAASRKKREITGVQSAPRAKFDDIARAKLHRIVQDNPHITPSEVARLMSLSPHTAKRWLETINA